MSQCTAQAESFFASSDVSFGGSTQNLSGFVQLLIAANEEKSKRIQALESEREKLLHRLGRVTRLVRPKKSVTQ